MSSLNIQKIINDKLLGFEIVRAENKYCISKCLSEINKDEFNNILKRSLLLLSSSNKQKDFRRETAFKLISGCKRIISKTGTNSLCKSLVLFNFLSLLEKDTIPNETIKEAYNLYQKYEAEKLNNSLWSNDSILENLSMMIFC